MPALRLLPLVALLLALASPLRAQTPSEPLAEETPVYLPYVGGNPALPNSLRVTTATYLGGAGADSASAVAIAADGSVLLGGTMPGHNPAGATPIALLGGGDGAVVRMNASGTEVRSVTRLGATLTDMEAGADLLVVCGAFGVAGLKPDAASLVWSASPGAAQRCAVGADGTAAALVGNQVYAYDAAGAALGSWSVAGTTAYDVAVDGANELVIVTGYTQVSGNLQLPYLRGYGYDGALRWRSYDFPDAPGLGADTRGERLAIGLDGKLYLAGSINGGTGVSVFSRDPKDIDARLGSDRLIVTDKYTNPYNIGSVKMAWFGRFNPADGSLERAQSLLTRLSSDRGNSISIKALAADAGGKLYVVGDTACCIKDRDGSAISGTTVGAYESGEGYFLAVSAGFRERLRWTPFTAPGGSAGGSPLVGVAVRDGVVALAGTLNVKAGTQRGLITVAPLQAQPGSATASEAYLVVAPAP
jgi:hypothetical protein